MKKGISFFIVISLLLIIVIGCDELSYEVTIREKVSPTTTTNLTPTQPIKLFNADGSYAVSKNAIVKGAKFLFFGYNWRVVNVSNDTATFWMDSPYTTSKFSNHINYGETQTANNTWSNGYYDATWDGQSLGSSTIRNFLITTATNNIIGTKAGLDKVIAGPISGVNEYDRTVTATVIYYRKIGYNDTKYVENQTALIDYGIGLTDKLWLPSYQEVKDNGLWGLTPVDRNWDKITVSQYAWLRTPSPGAYIEVNGELKKEEQNNLDALIVGYSSQITNNNIFESVYYDYVDEVYGVRPAIHLNIASSKKIE